ncbi:NPCBM/NEW2 domain-containing protein [Planctomyces sp. SH-PL14]|uniref:NPCBM/NEW2 domain-containing protein n=1 Tax=Planctomyces sp. SH-PL14 TaxID=1632864 RepID=UPI00078BA537|nr:NPCBM/NEW2 domain-containing protein [Planctomyces sp. SH-PL14]AMV22498.1 NPCBM/NEW2 domain protein [Planctomyces sp. SH-PL14]
MASVSFGYRPGQLMTVLRSFLSHAAVPCRPRCRLLIALAACLAIVSSVEAAGPAKTRRVVRLDEPETIEQSVSRILLREIVRQGFLMTARERFGAATRDEWLREPAGDSKDETGTFRVEVAFPASGQVTVSIGETGRVVDAEPWTATFEATPEELLETALARSVEWSRGARGATEPGPFVVLLRDAGFEPVPAEAAAGPALPEERIALDLVTLFGDLRGTHSALRASPDSVPLLARLARGYALLGSVTEVHWGTEHKTFKARALLYAEAAVQRDPENAEPLWSRALVRGLCGLPHRAIEDLDKARQKAPDAAPPWAEGLDPYVRWNSAELERLATAGKPLAGYLAFLAAELAGTDDERRAAANRCYQQSPECLRAVAVLAEDKALGLRRALGPAQLQQFLSDFPERLKTVPHRTAELDKALGSAVVRGDLAAAVAQHVGLVKALRSPEARGDLREPALPMLATLAENLSFVHVIQRLSTDADYVGIDTRETILALAPLLEGHPHRGFLRAYGSDPRQRRGALGEAVAALMKRPLSNTVYAYADHWGERQMVPYEPLMPFIVRQRDEILPDLVPWEVRPATDIRERQRRARHALGMAPKCPLAIVRSIDFNWKEVAPLAETWEKESPSAVVLARLAQQYENRNFENPKYAEASARILKIVVERHPSMEAYRKLATSYRRLEKYDLWKEALDKALEQPVLGLEHASICREIADWYMEQKQWQAAKPYALRAANSYSEWGLRCAVECCEGLGEWNEAEGFQKAISQRYADEWAGWYFWCRRTGRGNATAALDACFQYVSRLSPQQRRNLSGISLVYQLEGDLKQALEHRPDINSVTPPDLALRSIVILDQMNETEERDKGARMVLAQGGEDGATLLCEQLLRSGRGAPPFSEAEARYCQTFLVSGYGILTDRAWCLGRLLLTRNRRKEAVEWLKRAAGSPTTDRDSCVLASAELIRLGIDLPPRRAREMDDEFSVAWSALINARARIDSKKLDDAEKFVQEAITASPDFPPVWLVGGQVARIRGYNIDALARFTELVKLSPKVPSALVRRARGYEGTGQIGKAIEDYEAALAIAPDDRMTHIGLAMIRATCGEAKYRDATAAMRHARAAGKYGPGSDGEVDMALAAAYAEGKEFTKAADTLSAAIKSQRVQNTRGLLETLKVYEKREPLRRPVNVSPAIVRLPVEEERPKYRARITALRQEIDRTFADREAKAVGPDKETLAKGRARYESEHLLPADFPAELRKRHEASIQTMLAAYDAAIDSAVRSKLDGPANGLRKERQAFVDQVQPTLLLSRQEPAKVKVLNNWFTRDGRGLSGQSLGGDIRFGGQVYREAILAHPGGEDFSEVAIALSGEWETFTARVGVPEATDVPGTKLVGSNLTFEVLSDGKSLWKSQPSREIDKLQSCRVAFPKGAQIVLRVHCAKEYWFARAVWIEPRLTSLRFPPPPEPESAGRP